MRNPLFVSVEEMDNKDRKDEKLKMRVDIIKNKVIIVVIIIAIIIYVAGGVIDWGQYDLEKKRFESEQQQKEIEQQKEEEKKHPQMEVDMGSIAISGDKKYQVIYISNTNTNVTIKSGTLVVDCRIRGQSGDTSINCYLDGAIWNEKVKYIEELDRIIVLLRIDYQKFSEMIEERLEEEGISVAEGMVFQPYLFIYYKYTCGKENLEGYYKINIEEHGFGAVEEVDAPQNYFYVYEFEI